MQVITGKFRGRKLETIQSDKTRPTLARVKESLFSMIDEYIPDSVVLDLFAGSGSLGIEALSRGAKKVYFVDNNPEVKGILNRNLNKITDPYEILNCDYLSAINNLASKNVKLDLVFLDPPYDSDFGEIALKTLADKNLLNLGSIVVFEQDCKKCLQNAPKRYIMVRYKSYGLANLSILKYIGD